MIRSELLSPATAAAHVVALSRHNFVCRASSRKTSHRVGVWGEEAYAFDGAFFQQCGNDYH